MAEDGKNIVQQLTDLVSNLKAAFEWLRDRIGWPGAGVLTVLAAAAFIFFYVVLRSKDFEDGLSSFERLSRRFKRKPIRPAPLERFTVILADIVGDDSDRTQKRNIRDALKHYLGASIFLVSVPKSLAIEEGSDESELARNHARAQKILAEKRGDVLVWGRVKSETLLSLHFTGHHTSTTEGSAYRLEEERALLLDINFDRDLAAAIAARVVALGDALAGKQGNFLTPYAEAFAKKIAPLVARPKANWSDDAQGSVFFAYGLAKALAGREDADSTALEAFREALNRYTQVRVPLDWAATQMNLGNALATLGERERGTQRLEEAVAAYHAALEEYTRERVPLDWAATQMNLGNALLTLGERERGTQRLEEAVAAYRAALEEYTRARVPLQWAATQNNLGNALFRLGERERGTQRLEEAVAAFRAALEEFTEKAAPYWHNIAQENLGQANALLAKRRGTAPAHNSKNRLK